MPLSHALLAFSLGSLSQAARVDLSLQTLDAQFQHNGVAASNCATCKGCLTTTSLCYDNPSVTEIICNRVKGTWCRGGGGQPAPAPPSKKPKKGRKKLKAKAPSGPPLPPQGHGMKIPPVSPEQRRPPAPAPMYRCETVPTWKYDQYLQCGESEGDVACFSLNPFIEWYCPSKRLRFYSQWWDKSESACNKKRDNDNNYFDGRCVMKGHPDYERSDDYPDKKFRIRRSVPTRANWDESVPTWFKEPKYGLHIPKVGDKAIGWKPTKTWVAQGKWCGVQQPAKGWSPGAEFCKKTNLEVSVLSYNLYWWYLFDKMDGKGTFLDPKGGIHQNIDGALGKNMEAWGPFDVMGFQECNDVERVVDDANMAGFVDYYQGKNAVANAWRSDKFKNLQNGYEDVAEDMKQENWFGRRGVAWSRLEHKKTGHTIFFINHHGPLPDDTGGYCGPHATVYNILRIIAQRAHKGDSVVLVGDFNAQAKTTINNVLDQHLTMSFQGEDFKGVDKFYHNCPKTTAVKKTLNIGKGGSDHAGLVVTYEF